ncbi:MAG: prephenate dehydrogenase/arogenate dehydrogenase family protein [Clostridia bacterium]|nr:prephenate dehydrogenase/arogenate dehydrogenase family protein [Clostridia bacterium]
MKIGIVGLGLIGASIAKSLKINTSHVVFGIDKNHDINIKAKITRVIDDILEGDLLSRCEVIFLALNPKEAIDYLKNNAEKINEDCIVLDCCGTKQYVSAEASEIAKERGFTFIGTDPLAGGVQSGFENSKHKLFEGCDVVVTTQNDAPLLALEKVSKLLTQIGFANIEMSTPREHDRITAYTTQLMRIVASALVKSETAAEHIGFSDLNFENMTRDAALDEKVWAELFLENRENILTELEALIKRLREYETAMKNNSETEMLRLLKEGREKKEYIDNKKEYLWK